MRGVPISEAKDKLPALIRKLGRKTKKVVITKRGRAAAVLLSAAEYDSLQETLEILSDEDMMRQIRASQKKGYKARIYTEAELDKLFGIVKE